MIRVIKFFEGKHRGTKIVTVTNAYTQYRRIPEKKTTSFKNPAQLEKNNPNCGIAYFFAWLFGKFMTILIIISMTGDLLRR